MDHESSPLFLSQSGDSRVDSLLRYSDTAQLTQPEDLLGEYISIHLELINILDQVTTRTK